MNEQIRVDPSGKKVWFAKKFLPYEFFVAQLGNDYSYDTVGHANFHELVEQAGDGTQIWVYYDDGFSLFAILLVDEDDFQAFVKQAKKELYASIRFFKKAR